ncbi:MAG: amino acid ABC transporter permease [Clostridia bacterium]|nr:amino acid ABC transporter permease [Clostridia bacterium]
MVKTAPWFLRGAEFTLLLTVVGSFFGVILGLLAALARLSSFGPVRAIGTFYTWIFRGTPLLVQIFLVYFGLPSLGFTLFNNALVSGSVALSLNTGAYLAEVFRAAIESIPRGQMEAARSLGMSYAQAMRRVILPQGFRRMIPPSINQFVALLKDSSLVATISVFEITFVAKTITAASFRSFELFSLAALYYLVLTTLFTSLGAWVEKRLLAYE